MESIIRRRLVTDAELCANLAHLREEPAIFYQKAPSDADSPESLYPYIVLTVDRFSDPQKGVAGLLSAEIVCTETTNPPEELEKFVRARLEGVFLRPEQGEIFSLKWQRTDVFSEPSSERTPLIIGVTMTFELYEWPLAETSEPDPIHALNEWASRFEVAVIGVTEFSEFFEPTHDQPAIYFDTQRVRLAQEKSTTTWLDATINLHVFAPDVRSRRQWLAILNQNLIMERIIDTADGARLMLQDAEYLWSANEVQGQIQYKFRYAINREVPYAHPLVDRNITFSDKLRWQNVHNPRVM